MSISEPTLPEMEDVLEEHGYHLSRSRKISCPRHSDSEPSLHIYQDNWYCYGCGRNGDVLGLIALLENRDVRTVVREFYGHPHQRTHTRIQTKGLSTADADRFVQRLYTEAVQWWFGQLATLYADSPIWHYLRALDVWSEVFDDLADRIAGYGDYYEDKPLRPIEAERAIKALRRTLQDTLPLEQEEARRFIV